MAIRHKLRLLSVDPTCYSLSEANEATSMLRYNVFFKEIPLFRCADPCLLSRAVCRLVTQRRRTIRKRSSGLHQPASVQWRRRTRCI